MKSAGEGQNMQHYGVVGKLGSMRQNWAAPQEAPLLARFLSKLVLDVLPAALASMIGGFLFTQYQFGHAVAVRAAAEQAMPASPEMMQLVRDEHAAMMEFLKSQRTAEKIRLVATDEDSAPAADDAKPAVAAARPAAVVVPAKPVAGRSKVPAVASVVIPTHAPLVIAQTEHNEGTAAAASAIAQPASKSILSQTLDIKDHVVDATLGATFAVVNTLGSIPSWIASIGDRVGGSRSLDATSGLDSPS
jgi:hypothetical protein